jgi:ADP-ribose pyrophosphatase
LKETKHTSKKVYECSFMSLYEDQVILKDQRITERIYIKHPGGAAMLATTDEDKIILIKQFRYPLDEIIYEIPAGKMDIELESFKNCAIRELEEETGYHSNDVSFLYQIYPCVGYSDEKIEIYRAKHAYKVNNPLPQDMDENIESYLFTREETQKLLEKNMIKDGKTLIAIQYWLNEK